MTKKSFHSFIRVLGIATAVGSAACRDRSGSNRTAIGDEQRIADAMYLVMSSDRAVYAREVVDRLQNREKVMAASEHWREEKRLPLPAQMFRMGAELAREKRRDISYDLVSKWPINTRNAPHTDAERRGMDLLAADPGGRFSAEEELGGSRYFTAMYPDVAVSPACVDCHNKHEQSSRHHFRVGDVMGAVVIRIARR
jgi:hypothetical protein